MSYYVYLLYLGANCPGYYLQLSFVCVCVSFILALHIDSENPFPLFVLLLGFDFGLYFFLLELYHQKSAGLWLSFLT